MAAGSQSAERAACAAFLQSYSDALQRLLDLLCQRHDITQGELTEVGEGYRSIKPKAAIGAVVVSYKILEPGAPLPAEPEDGRYAGMASTDKFVLPVTPADAGKVLWTQAFYITAKGLAGPASAAVTARIAA